MLLTQFMHKKHQLTNVHTLQNCRCVYRPFLFLLAAGSGTARAPGPASGTSMRSSPGGRGQTVSWASTTTNWRRYLYKYLCLSNGRPGGGTSCGTEANSACRLHISNDCSESSGLTLMVSGPGCSERKRKWWNFLMPGRDLKDLERKECQSRVGT